MDSRCRFQHRPAFYGLTCSPRWRLPNAQVHKLYRGTGARGRMLGRKRWLLPLTAARAIVRLANQDALCASFNHVTGTAPRSRDQPSCADGWCRLLSALAPDFELIVHVARAGFLLRMRLDA